MPSRPARNCTRPGCSGTVRGGVCTGCGSKRASNWHGDRVEGSSHARGYGATWQKLRKTVLADQPLCVECLRFGRVTAATDVDHIVPKHLGGPNDTDNLQPLCRACHRRKTSGESQLQREYLKPSAIPCTVVAGAPGSGKTMYVRNHRVAGDLVVDLDALYVALSGGLDWYDKPIGLLPFVCEARDAVLARLSRASDVRGAWVITGEADYGRLQWMVQQLDATLVVLDTQPNECLRHIANDPRRVQGLGGWSPAVYAWFRKYNATREQYASDLRVADGRVSA